MTKRGYVQRERKGALDILDEFPEDNIYYIPIRLEECQFSSERLRTIQYVDFYPDWQAGFNKVLQAINRVSPVEQSIQAHTSGGYEYHCAIADFDNGMTNLPQLCQRLNSIQRVFHFTHPAVTLGIKRPRSFEGVPNLFINAAPNNLYQQKAEPFNADFVACLTHYLLAFDDDGLHWNYLSAPSLIDDTVLFISTNQLYEISKQAGCTFEKSIVYNLLSQLIVYFVESLGFHQEVRGCILDFCVERAAMLKGLRAMRLCPKCLNRIKNERLKKAIFAILAEELRV